MLLYQNKLNASTDANGHRHQDFFRALSKGSN